MTYNPKGTEVQRGSYEHSCLGAFVIIEEAAPRLDRGASNRCRKQTPGDTNTRSRDNRCNGLCR